MGEHQCRPREKYETLCELPGTREMGKFFVARGEVPILHVNSKERGR